MSFERVSHAGLKVAVAALTLCSAIGTSWAGTPVNGEWDPAIGGVFNLLGWRGTARFDVPPGCLTAGPVSVFSTDPCVVAGGGLNFLGATVQFYKLSDAVTPAGSPTLDTVVYGAGTLAVNGIDVLNNKVTKVDSGYTAFQLATGGSSYNGLDLYGFALRFDDMFDATLVYGRRSEGGFIGTPASSEAAGNVAQAPVIYATPEPGTLALVAGAAALAAWVRRRA